MTTTVAAFAMSDPRMAEAVAAIAAWQKTVVYEKYTHDLRTRSNAPARLKAQQRLLRAAFESSAETAAVIRTQAGGKVTDEVLKRMPKLDFSVTKHEFDKMKWNTASMLHEDLEAGGCGRGHALEFGWWHLLTLRQLERGSFFPDPPRLLVENYQGRLPFKVPSLDASPNDISDKEHQGLHTATRNILRRGGGIFYSDVYPLFDAPLAKRWWQAELAKSSKPELPAGLTVQHAYEALSAGWWGWARLAVRSCTRLAAPTCIAAYVLAAARSGQHTGKWPRGEQSKKITARLMRTTQHLNVHLVSAEHLAALASPA